MLAVLVRVFIIKWVFDFLFRFKKESYVHFQSNNNYFLLIFFSAEALATEGGRERF
jgi:hypothetical protein